MATESACAGLLGAVCRGNGQRACPRRLYSNRVHVELRKDRAVAADFPMSQRYLAASQVLSRGALAALDTLAFVKALDEAGILELPGSLWTEDVVAPV